MALCDCLRAPKRRVDKVSVPIFFGVITMIAHSFAPIGVMCQVALLLSGCGDRAAFRARENAKQEGKENSGDAVALPPGADGNDSGSATTDGGDGSSGVDGGGVADGAIEPAVDEATQIVDLEKRCASGQTKSFEQRIRFPKPTVNCAWGTDANLAFDRGNQLIITARREEPIALELSSTARLCDMSYDFPVQTMRYDDEIMLLFNNVVLAASQNYDKVGELEAKDGFLRYDWSKLVGDVYPIRTRPNYFIDSDCVDCTIPPTETVGSMKLTVKPETVRKLSVNTGMIPGSALDSTKHQFTFVTTGDNDASLDCMHADFEFTVKANYVE